jgi:FkbM family methyltransferase
MRALLKKALESWGVEIKRANSGTMHAHDLLDMLRYPDQKSELADFIRYAAANVRRSHSQLFQDLFVIKTLQETRDGYFVEFGATDGIKLSNTVLLERDYGWRGIVAEPARYWHDALRSNRTCSIDLRCVWKSSGETVSFSETEAPDFSTVTAFSNYDGRDRSRAKQYNVETVSLNDLLSEHKAPRKIDYLSIDTEGTELTILKELDFNKWSFRIITVEHNFNSKNRKSVRSLLTSKGYVQALKEITRYDDWYVLKD